MCGFASIAFAAGQHPPQPDTIHPQRQVFAETSPRPTGNNRPVGEDAGFEARYWVDVVPTAFAADETWWRKSVRLSLPVRVEFQPQRLGVRRDIGLLYPLSYGAARAEPAGFEPATKCSPDCIRCG